jgi:hypothetical protein
MRRSIGGAHGDGAASIPHLAGRARAGAVGNGLPIG